MDGGLKRYSLLGQSPSLWHPKELYQAVSRLLIVVFCLIYMALSTSAVLAQSDAVQLQLPDAGIGQPYNVQLAPTIVNPAGFVPQGSAGTNMVRGYNFSQAKGKLPEGMTLTNGGLLSGKPTKLSSFNFSVAIQDKNGRRQHAKYTILVSSISDVPVGVHALNSSAVIVGLAPLVAGEDLLPNPRFSTFEASQNIVEDGGISLESDLPDVQEGEFYSHRIVPIEPDGPFTFTLLNDALPDGLNLSSDGVLSGVTCDGRGSYKLEVRIESPPDFVGVFDKGDSLRVHVGSTGNPNLCSVDGVEILPPSLSDGVYGTTYEQQLSVVNSTADFTFSLSQGSLTPGLTLATDGTISGVPTETGLSTFTVTATADGGFFLTKEYTLNVVPILNGLEIDPDNLPVATLGEAYSQQLTTSGGAGNYMFAQIASTLTLPNGITLSTDGLISGIPTEAGNFNFSVEVTDGQGNTGSAAYTLAVEEGFEGIVISPTNLPAGAYRSAYSQQLTATGGDGTYFFGLASGTLPSGMSLDINGLLSGTPVETGSFAITVRVADGQGNTGTQAYTLVIAPVSGLIVITPPALPEATFGVAYNVTLGATGGDGDYAGEILSGSLPSGITFRTTDGTFLGTPAVTGSFPLVVKVTDGQGNASQINYTLVVVPVTTLEISPATVPDGTFNAAYSQQLSVSGGDGSYAFSLSNGSLPSGLTLSSGGVISGNPTQTGDFTFQTDVTDGAGNTGTRAYTLTIAALTDLVIAPSTLPAGEFGAAYSQQLTTSGGDGSYSYAMIDGALPTGLALVVDGLLSGTPVETGSFTFTVKVADGQGNTGAIDYTLVINLVDGLLVISPDTLEEGVFESPYEQVFSASGGDNTYVYELTTEDSLPTGLALSPAGELTGRPLRTGSFDITVSVQDGQGNTGEGTYILVIAPGIGILLIEPATLPEGLTTQPYEVQLLASGGIREYFFSIESGELPSGLILDGDTGFIFGIPEESGVYNLSVSVIDSQGNTGSVTYALIIALDRPDPSTDPEVIELIEAQFKASRRLVESLRFSILRRLDSLRDKFDCNPIKNECLRMGIWQDGRMLSEENGSSAVYSAGIDYQMNSNLIVGLTLGYGQSISDVREFGSISNARANSIAGYFINHLREGFYIDGLIGVSDLKYSNQRYLTGIGGFEQGQRDGTATFLSLRASGEYQVGSGTTLSPFVRYDAQQTDLEGYSETGGTSRALTYTLADQSFQRISLGINAQQEFQKPWGLMLGWIEAEFGHERISGYQQNLFYSDTLGTSYSIQSPEQSQNRITLRAGVDVELENTTFSFELFTSKSQGDANIPIGVSAQFTLDF